MSNRKWSFYAFIACVVFMLYATFCFYPKWHKPAGESSLGWDVAGYYMYLPAVFIYKDLKKQEFGDSIIKKYQFTPSFDQSFWHRSGSRVFTYSSGMALMYTPWFFMAHVLAKPLGYEADGFSTPYQFAMQVGSMLFALIGIWYFRKLLLLYFSDGIVAWLLLLLVYGSNYLNYTAIDGPLTHNYLFTIYVFLLLNTYHFYKTPDYKYAIRIGLLCGLAILIRPSEMICILIPLLWNMESISFSAIRNKFNFLLAHIKEIIACSISVVLVAGIQVLYWYYVTGEFLVYSYQEKTFSWLRPHVYDYMLSYRSGWITYTPLVICFFLGVIPFLFKGRNRVAVILFSALNLYIVCAWDIWFYGGTGGRAMLQSYPVLFFFLGSFLQFVFSKPVLKWLVSPVIILLAYFNIWFTYNAHAAGGLYDPVDMTKAYYWKVIYRYDMPRETQKLKDTPEFFEGTPANMQLLYSNNFESDTTALPEGVDPINGAHSLFMSDKTSSPEYCMPYSSHKPQWIRAQGTFHCFIKEWDGWRMTKLTVRFKKDGKIVKENFIRLFRLFTDGETKDLYIDSRLPKEEFDTVCIILDGNECTKTLLADDLKIWSFEEK